jgi:hypothetical protein
LGNLGTWGTSTSLPPPSPELCEEGLLRLGNISYYLTESKKKWTHYGLFIKGFLKTFESCEAEII